MMKETAIARSVRLVFAGGLALGATAFAQPVLAQDAIQRIEVTGSNIRRSQTETASPVTVITREELEKSGKATVAEYLQTMTTDGAGSLPTGFGNGFAAGSTAISLRGLGATSTLVLLNGRRMAAFGRADDGQKSFTDLSTIPMEAVQRIEVLKDGASSIYGADAIAGVVNIILRKEFQGVAIKGTYGTSRYSDYDLGKASITGGFGNLDKNGYSVVLNAEFSKQDGLLNKDRADRAWIGHGDIRPWGYAMANQFAAGHITSAGSPSPTGSLLAPATATSAARYVALPGCASLSTASPQDPAGGCVWYTDQFRSMQPNVKQTNLFAGLTVKLNDDWSLYGEAGFAARRTDFTMIPPSVTPTVVYPGGITNYGSGAGTALTMAATHPQNPYGVPVRIRYSAFDVGPSVRNADNDYTRFVIGARGSAMGWDIDTAYVHSATKLNLAYTNMLNMQVVAAALSNPASQYFPYYVGAQASKNPASLYAAMVRTATSHSTTSLDLADFKASRELPWSLPGGNVGLAVGAEYRKDEINNPSLSGTENGSINANYVAAFGSQKVYAVYAEAVAPLLKELEANIAIRHDKYDNFSSTTPKLGLKYTPLRNFALRGTYAEGFRAPGAAESGSRSQSTGTASARDPIRCPGGTPAPGAQQSDCNTPIAGVKVGDPNLRPETSRGVTLGMVWDITPNTSMAIDAWRIKRSDEINPMPYNEVAARPDAIRSDNNLVKDGKVVPNSGTLIVAFAPYRNSSYTQVKGLDLDLSHRLNLGAYGRLRGDLKITHLFSWLRAESATVQYQYAGTHGNCDTSNCAGTAQDKATLALSWDMGPWQVATTTNHRSAMEMRYFKGDACAFFYADGAPAPKGCRLPSFTTTDLSVKYKFSSQLELFGSVTNLFDKIAPLDPLTYGGVSYNPMDASGAIGRYMKVGARYQF